MSTLPLLSIVTLAPALAAFIVLLLPRGWTSAPRVISLIAGTVSLAGAIAVFVGYDRSAGGYQFIETVRWMPSVGIAYRVGVDGISVPLVLLTSMVIFTGVLVSWKLGKRSKEFFFLLLLLVAGVFGVFVALDAFLFFFFYEMAVLPMYLLIAIWGSTRKDYAAMKLTLFLFGGSALLVLSLVMTYWAIGAHTFDLRVWQTSHLDVEFQRLVFLISFVGFGTLIPIFPLHTWSPDGHVAAPTAVSMLHAGVLLKLGAYGVFRLSMPIYPEGWAYWAFPIAIIGAVNVVYGALCAMNQTDLKYVIGYSSVSHMGYVLLGIGVGGMYALTGAVFQMFAHGIMTALFFALVGYVYETTHTRQIAELTGLMRVMPLVSAAFVIAGAASLGLPSTAGFVAELLVYVGLIKTYPLLAAVAFVGVAVTATYVLRMLSRILLGEPQPSYADATDPTFIGRIPILLLATTIMLAGLFPASLIETIQSGLKPLLARLGGG